MCFPIFSHGENGKKSKWKEREINTFPSLSICFFSHFSPWRKWENTFFHGQKWGWTPFQKVQLFDKLEDFRDNLIKELDYIADINENVLNYKIDMSTFDQNEFDNVKFCKYCNYDFKESYNGRQITLTEKVNKYKLKRIIDDFQNNE